MSLVVDTSLAAKWLIEEAGSDKAQGFIGEDLIAPELILAELSNVIWKKWRSGSILREHAQISLASLQSFVTVVPMESLAHDALETALYLDHPVYDCYFLALAGSVESKLVTFDKKLMRVCEGTRCAQLIEYLGE